MPIPLYVRVKACAYVCSAFMTTYITYLWLNYIGVGAVQLEYSDSCYCVCCNM